MTENRQALPAAEDAIVVRSLGLRLPTGYRVEPHSHPWHQLVYATEGVMTVGTSTGSWVVPALRAVWIPSGFEHSVRMTGQVRMQTLYLHPDLGRLPTACSVINVAPLLRELILEILRLHMLVKDVPEQARLAAVLVDQIRHTRETPLRIKLPKDARALRVAESARADLAATKPISELVRRSGASVRTIERLFHQETGLTFGRWLQQVKALHALERLAAGDSVTAAGLAVGYDSTSAFIAMFRRVLGTTPGSYFARAPRGSA
jgi:AraC-like DNA-binding protein